ncbi:response regulator transcription factor [Candidatus Bipolaricaulota bacterium]|nr:response regulator transcription factor [Candidatus Bipolaricaulota bacterium]
MNKKILVVDDDKELVDFLKDYFEKDGYSVIGTYDGKEALQLFRKREFDLVVLDLMLPEMDGYNVCKRMRRDSEVPIVMLTAKTADEEKIKGLDLGADDYVTKPFNPGELLARIRASLRRVEDEDQPKELTYGDLTVNFSKKEVLFNNEPVDITPTEFKILAALVKEPDKVFSRTQLIHAALGYGYESFERTIDVHIKHLRDKIEPDPQNPGYIKTVFGMGYKFDSRGKGGVSKE